jgi:hypothetical protein
MLITVAARSALKSALKFGLALTLGVTMTMDAASMTAAERVVLDYLHSNLGINGASVDVSTLSARDLPAGSAEFYVETKGSREHGAINCVLLDGKVYCSRTSGDFARLMKDQRALETKSLTAAQMMRLYALLGMPRQVKYVDAGVLARNPDYKNFPDTAVPALMWPATGGAVLTFFATPLDRVAPAKWTVNVSPHYDVAVVQPQTDPAR